MKLIFDLDGTLFPCNDVEEGCYIATCREILGSGPDPDWGRYAVVTDLGIFRGHAMESLGRAPLPQEEEAFKEAYPRRLREALGDAVQACLEPLPGAQRMLDQARTRYAVGIATGNIRKSALLKLGFCGLDVHDLPLITGECARDRPGLLRLCLEALGPQGDTAVAIGDGIWDVAAARVLGLGFVGIASTDHAVARLRRAGARAIIPDYTDLEGFWRLLEELPGLDPG